MTVTYEISANVAWVTIDRPGSMNAVDGATRAGLFAAVERFNADDEAKVLVLTGAGERAFCAGADLKEISEVSLRVPPIDFIPQFGRNVDVPKPTIAAVNGVAFGAGFLLAQNCDLVVASSNAKFSVPEVRLGRGAPWAVPLLRQIPRREAMRLLLTGAAMGADEARAMGFVNEVTEPEHLVSRVQSLAEEIASNAPLAVAAAKRMVIETADLELSEAFDVAEQVWDHVYYSDDAQEGPRAFAEHRRPQWSGR